MPKAPTGADAGRDPQECLLACVAAAVPAGRPLLLAVSGGIDSMALLAAAADACPERVAVVHVRHRLRPEAEREAALVEDACRQLGVPFLGEDAGPGPGDLGRTETAARSRRFAALERACRRAGAHWVLLAHHADDDVETFVLRWLRGHRGDRALCGIPTVRPLGEQRHVLRPFLLGVRPPGRADLARLLRSSGLPHAEDASNADERIPRNLVRAALARGELPRRAALLALRGAARTRLAARLLRAAAALADGLRAEGLGASLSLDALAASPAVGGAPPPDASVEPAGGGPAGSASLESRDGLQDLAEVLRLLGGCLARARRVDPRASVLAAVRALVTRGSGRLDLPASPAPVTLRGSRQALRLPDESLRPGPGAARVLEALSRTSLYL